MKSGAPVPSPHASAEVPLLRVRDLCKHFPIMSKGFFRKQVGVVKAVDQVSFDLLRGETLGLVGEQVWRVPSLLVPDPTVVSRQADLERALVEIRRILEMAEAISFV